MPTSTPSTTPSTSPSEEPTKTPSVGPTDYPSATPSSIPSTSPSSTPSEAPTAAIDFELIATWSSTYLSIYINIMNNDPGDNNVELKYNSLQSNPSTSSCGVYFDERTMNVIGHSSTCFWQVNPTNPTNENDIRIQISYASTSPPNIYLNSSLTLRPGAFEYRFLSTQNWLVLNDSITINMIYPATNPVQPDITTTVKTLLGICDSLILDASNTQNLGERPGDYYWEVVGEIVDPDDNDIVLFNRSVYKGNDKIFEWNEIKPDTDLMVYLNVSSWFGEQSYKVFDIYKDNKPQPQITLDGPTLFSINNENFGGVIILTSIITFDDTCLQNVTAHLPYRLDWGASCDFCDNIDDLNAYLTNISVNNDKVDRVSILAETYLEVGSSYTFTVAMNCVEELECSTEESLTMNYVYSDIQCQIENGDINLGEMTRDQFISYNTLY